MYYDLYNTHTTCTCTCSNQYFTYYTYSACTLYMYIIQYTVHIHYTVNVHCTVHVHCTVCRYAYSST